MVQRGGKGQDDGGLLSALQIELCMHSPCIPVIFANDANAFATMVELRVSGKCPASSAEPSLARDRRNSPESTQFSPATL